MKKYFLVYISSSVLIAASALFLLPHRAMADSCTVFDESGNWSSVSWSCGHVPGAGDDVRIGFMMPVTITADMDISVESITLSPFLTLNAGNKTIQLNGTVPLQSNQDSVLAGTSTVVLSDTDLELQIDARTPFTFYNLIMEPLTVPHTVSLGHGGFAAAFNVTNYFISGSSSTNQVSFVKGDPGSDLSNAVTSYYCASNGGISNINCLAGGPTAPTDFSAAAVSSTQIDLSWDCAATDETGFKIFRDGTLINEISGPNNVNWADHTTAADTVSYSDTGLTPGTTYNYEIRTTVLGTDSTADTASATTDSAGTTVTTVSST
ncbi:MAG: hypothetical protein D3913_13105, partial [Candidatus Electrothrix sp. LOE1_4_5]|nr:hypothetical protein [Candidatus Electrothrix gigas]